MHLGCILESMAASWFPKFTPSDPKVILNKYKKSSVTSFDGYGKLKNMGSVDSTSADPDTH